MVTCSANSGATAAVTLPVTFLLQVVPFIRIFIHYPPASRTTARASSELPLGNGLAETERADCTPIIVDANVEAVADNELNDAQPRDVTISNSDSCR